MKTTIAMVILLTISFLGGQSLHRESAAQRRAPQKLEVSLCHPNKAYDALLRR
jgi:hypothetical protein